MRVDENSTYMWLGDPSNVAQERAILTDVRITPTRTILNLTAGLMDLKITFLSPIEVRHVSRERSAS